MIAGIKEELLAVEEAAVVAEKQVVTENADMPIENLDLSVRVFNSLKRTGVTTVGDVVELLGKGEEAVMSIRNFGEKSLDGLRDKMQEKGLLKNEQEEDESE